MVIISKKFEPMHNNQGQGKGDWIMEEGKVGKGFEGDQQPHESTLKGDQDSSLCLFKMMVDNDLIEFRCNYILMCETWNCICKEDTCKSIFFFNQ